MDESVSSSDPSQSTTEEISFTVVAVETPDSKDLVDGSGGSGLTRSKSKSSVVSDAKVGGKEGEDGMTGVIVIRMDSNDNATITTESRGSSSMDQRHPSETNDTDHDEVETNDNNDLDNSNIEEAAKAPSSRRSNSSSTGGATIPVMLVDQRRSTPSSVSSVSSSSLQRHQHTSSQDSANATPRKHTNLPRQTPSTDPPDAPLTTTVTRETVSRRLSATEFQKFRDQLHSVPANPAFEPENDEWQLHPNPHRPKTRTEILRIERTYTPITLPTNTQVNNVANFDVLVPRFSPSYPPILREYGISENEWRGFIERVNRFCMEAFDPFRWSNIIVNVIALLSCWLSEWIMPNLAKRVCSLYCPF
jgi:hypothetical protein